METILKKAMISQPMAGKTPEAIKEEKELAVKKLEEMGYEIVNTYFEDEWASKESMNDRGVVHIPVAFMAKSIEHMAKVDAVYFCKDWNTARGCRIEHEIAKDYGLTIIHEVDEALTVHDIISEMILNDDRIQNDIKMELLPLQKKIKEYGMFIYDEKSKFKELSYLEQQLLTIQYGGMSTYHDTLLTRYKYILARISEKTDGQTDQ